MAMGRRGLGEAAAFLVALLLAVAAGRAQAQGSKTCQDDGNGNMEAASTADYQLRLGYSCSVLGGDPPYCREADWRSMVFSQLSVPDSEEDCHMYHCSAIGQCDMCSGQAAGHVLTEPCSCQTVRANQRASYPHNCVPNPLAARGGPCVYGYQCATGFCCPNLKICLTDSTDGGALPLSPDWVKDIVSGGGACPQGLNDDRCKNYEDGEPTADFDQTVCGCSADYMGHFNAETWAQCGTACTCGGGSPCPAADYASCSVGDTVRAQRPIGSSSLWSDGQAQSLNSDGTMTVVWDLDSTTSSIPLSEVWSGRHQCSASGTGSAPSPAATPAPTPAPPPTPQQATPESTPSPSPESGQPTPAPTPAGAIVSSAWSRTGNWELPAGLALGAALASLP